MLFKSTSDGLSRKMAIRQCCFMLYNLLHGYVTIAINVISRFYFMTSLYYYKLLLNFTFFMFLLLLLCQICQKQRNLKEMQVMFQLTVH